MQTSESTFKSYISKQFFLLISLACVSSKTYKIAKRFLPYLGHKKGVIVQGFPSEDRGNWDLRIFAWSKPCMFCKESLGKIKFRAFPKCVSPRILSLKSVDYFGTSEHYRVVEKKNRNLN